MRRLLVLLFIFALSGCAASGARYTPDVLSDPGKAIIYAYRPSITINCCVSPAIFVNGKEQGVLKNGGYLALVASPGITNIRAVNTSVGFAPLDLQIDVKAGEAYYLRWSASAKMGVAAETEEGDLNSAIFASSEAKKRAEEIRNGLMEKVERAVEKSVTWQGIVAFEHGREFRRVSRATAEQELAETRKSE